MHPPFERFCRWYTTATAAVAVLVGAAVLAGWQLGLPALTSVFPGGATMKPITATSFVGAGLALSLLRDPSAGAVRVRAGRLLAALVALAGALSFAQWELGVELGVDRLVLAAKAAAAAPGVAFPGRMAPATSGSFLLLGTALALVGVDTRRVRAPAALPALAVVLIAWIALNGYVLGVQAFYRIWAYSSMALHTAALFVLLGLAVLAARPAVGVARILGADDGGGRVARTLLPVAALLPLALGAAALALLRERALEPEIHQTVFGIAYAILFSVVILLGARSVSRLESDRRRAQEETRALQLQAAQSAQLATVGTLAAGVAHEINNPLAYVIASLDFLEAQRREGLRKGDYIPDEVREALADAREGAGRVRDIVRDLKTFSRADHEGREPVAIEPILESAVQIAGSELRYRARVVRDFRGAPTVVASPGRLGQVFVNLLVNAAQAIPEGTADDHEIRVTTRTAPDGAAVVEVADTGSGIPPELLGRIFDPFFTTKPVGVGTGLGLSICHNIVSGLGGSIEVESAPDRGSTFRVRLPAAPAGSLPAPPARPPTPTPTPAPGTGTGTGTGRRRVLVVDDEPAVGTALVRILGREHDVTVVTGAREARLRIEVGDRWDVILCDLMMPDATGMELHADLEARAPDQATRMIFMSGGAFTEAARSFLGRVPNPRIEKPFDPATLRALVRGASRREDAGSV